LTPAPRAAESIPVSVSDIDRPICEPVELRPGAGLRVEHVRQGPGSPATAPFPHFHDVHELVLFGEVSGHFIAEGRRYTLTPGCVAFVPSMCQHDYALGPGRRDWVLIQIDAIAGETLGQAPGLERLAGPFCARPDPTLRDRLLMLAQWLTGLRAADALALPIVELLLRALVRAPGIEGEALTASRDRLDRLRPALDRLRRDPAHAPSLEQAAALCALSPAYFSRRFRQQIGLAWSDYVRTHRLHLASRSLLEGDQGIAEIAYRLGFATPSHFGELFHRRFGMTPKAYRQAGRAAAI
jgi:AraC-like DNA-binding protein